jgi:protein arginine kinase activator
MECEKCKKSKATYHLTSIEDGKKKEGHLCETCARDSGLNFKFNFSPSEIFKMSDASKSDPSKKEKTDTKTKEKDKQHKCPDCGVTLEQIKSNLRVGCANDYELFHNDLEKIVLRIHGKAQHVGKIPTGADVVIKKEAELKTLKRDLDLVVKSENYEKAAELRDKIRALETEIKVQA